MDILAALSFVHPQGYIHGDLEYNKEWNANAVVIKVSLGIAVGMHKA